MNLDKIFKYKEILQKELTFDEISKLYKEILYNEYEKLKDYQAIHMYQILRGDIDIFTQMRKGREFDEDYLKNSIRW